MDIPEELSIYFCLYEEIHYNDYLESTIIGNFVRISDVLVSWEFTLNPDIQNDYE